MPTATSPAKPVAAVLDAVETLEGAGFVVRRPFPVGRLEQIDPFLLLDHMGPAVHEPGEAQGAPDHPHRGFETVSYLLAGELEHEDSAGHHGILGPGDVQWMTAGAGVVHSEMPSRRFQREGGTIHGFQIWVNLPRDAKRIPPRYQEVPAASIPRVEQPGVVARVVAGEGHGVRGAVETHTPITYVHLTVDPGAAIRWPVPADWNAMVYAISGDGRVGDDATVVAEGQLAVLARVDGDVAVAVPADRTEPLEALLLAGRPINEPLFRYGPFVMNTKAEIVEAIEDFQAGRLGQIPRG